MKKVNQINRAFNNKLTEKEQKRAQELEKLEIETNLKQSTLYGQGGEVVRYDRITHKNKKRDIEMRDKQVTPTMFMHNKILN